MDEKIKELLKSQRKKVTLLASMYRRKLEEELQAECIRHGGHDFWDWQPNYVYSIGGYILRTHSRVCSICGFAEYRNDEKDFTITGI